LGLSIVSEPTSRSFTPPALPTGTPEWVWDVLRGAARHAREAPTNEFGSYALGAGGSLKRVAPGVPGAVLDRRIDGAWVPVSALARDVRALFDLYLPICAARSSAPVTIGHLGQSLDGYIATHAGDSSYINGPENILHLHRMRALCDAVVVGAGTIADDDPRLTTRLAAGANPVRVILDPRRRLKVAHRVFNDGEAESLLVCDADLGAEGDARIGGAEVLGIPCAGGRLDLAALLEALHARGLNSVFVEGGGTTVSRFLEAGLLDRMQIAVAPLVMGRGRPGLRLPATERIAECLRPAHRVFTMGADILFDCDLRQPESTRGDGMRAALERIY
jgi:diaminohydroxyphosphoribosylaminopyrimidine deaminase / 5-amino-6-(5-phosphoribosylamino)uracil reductase